MSLLAHVSSILRSKLAIVPILTHCCATVTTHFNSTTTAPLTEEFFFQRVLIRRVSLHVSVFVDSGGQLTTSTTQPISAHQAIVAAPGSTVTVVTPAPQGIYID